MGERRSEELEWQFRGVLGGMPKPRCGGKGVVQSEEANEGAEKTGMKEEGCAKREVGEQPVGRRVEIKESWGRVAGAVAEARGMRVCVALVAVVRMMRGMAIRSLEGQGMKVQGAKEMVFVDKVVAGMVKMAIGGGDGAGAVAEVYRGAIRGGVELGEVVSTSKEKMCNSVLTNCNIKHIYKESRRGVAVVKTGRDGGDNDDADVLVPEGTRGTER